MSIVKIQGPNEMQFGIHYEYDTESLPLGQGGMGTVYEGYCINDNNGEYFPVAIKQVSNTSTDLIERAIREASIQIDHPNLLRMYGFISNMEWNSELGRYAPQHYLVMERLIGVDLDTLIGGVTMNKSGVQIPYAKELYYKYVNNRRDTVIEIMKGVLEGVKELHSKGYIHRDIDPSNIMITLDNKVKLIDYGISRSLTANNQSDRYKTASGLMIGKIDYAAPELISGDISKHGIPSDIYSLGIMLYQLFVGSLPFIGDQTAVMRMQLMEPMPVQNIQDLTIREVVYKATQKEVGDRYQSVDEFLSDLLTDRKEDEVDGHGSPEVSNIPTWAWILSVVIGLLVGVGIAMIINFI